MGISKSSITSGRNVRGFLSRSLLGQIAGREERDQRGLDAESAADVGATGSRGGSNP